MAFSIFSLVAAVASFLGTAALGRYLLPILSRLCVAQPVVKDGKKTEELKKPTPSMGGLSFLIPTVISALVFIVCNSFASKTAGVGDVKIWAGIVMSFLVACVGFLEDFFTSAKENGTGFSLWQKLLLQGGVVILYLASLWVFGDQGTGTTYIPFVGTVELGFWYYLISLPLILAVINAAGETEDADGLCSTVGFFSIVSVMMTSGILLSHDNGIFAASAAGGCIGFLLFNFYPAKLKPGKTGSWFIGAVLCAVAYGANVPVLLPLYALVFLAEGLLILLDKAVKLIVPGKKLLEEVPLHKLLAKRDIGDMQISACFGAAAFIAGVLAVTIAASGRMN